MTVEAITEKLKLLKKMYQAEVNEYLLGIPYPPDLPRRVPGHYDYCCEDE